jgi:6-phosphogluconolactonase (cycloisomerase 2 family)
MAMSTNDLRASSPRPAGGPRVAYVGCFTTERRKARGKGIGIYAIDPVSGAWSPAGHVGDLVNPSFLVMDAARAVLYAVHGDADYVSAFAVDRQTGALRQIAKAASGGMNGVHQALDPTRQFLVVANYASGSVALLPVRPDGALDDVSHLLDLPGAPGPHRTEQTIAHPHHIVCSPGGRFILVPDKGLDRVFVLRLDAAAGTLAVASEATMRPGAGPRHMVFHPTLPFAFVVNELDSTVATCRWHEETGVLEPLHLVSALPPDFFGASTTAAIVITPDGRHVYVSNRGQDGITRLVFDAGSETLVVRGWTPANGRDPRFMTLSPDGTRLIVAAEQGDFISQFVINETDGNLTPGGAALSSASPCTIAFF